MIPDRATLADVRHKLRYVAQESMGQHTSVHLLETGHDGTPDGPARERRARRVKENLAELLSALAAACRQMGGCSTGETWQLVRQAVHEDSRPELVFDGPEGMCRRVFGDMVVKDGYRWHLRKAEVITVPGPELEELTIPEAADGAVRR